MHLDYPLSPSMHTYYMDGPHTEAAWPDDAHKYLPIYTTVSNATFLPFQGFTKQPMECDPPDRENQSQHENRLNVKIIPRKKKTQ